jgi:NUMOD4 motif/HNH endonuclease
MAESWQKIPFFENYEASDLGRVRRIAGQRRPTGDGILTPWFEKQTGYLRVGLRRDGKTMNVYIHAAVCSAFNGAAPSGTECAHWDGDKLNNSAKNLRWATPVENSADMERHGRRNCGSRNGMAILTEAQVSEIRRMKIPHGAARSVADAYGVSRTTIYNIRAGRGWKNVGG